MIAVAGATGRLGRLVIKQLVAQGRNDVIAWARSPEKAQDLGVRVREADYNRPEMLDEALKDIDVLVLISSNEEDQRKVQHDHVIRAAKRQGVQRIIYTSMLHADRSPLSLAESHRYTESALKASGLAYTILRNGWYTENHTSALGAALTNGVIVGSSGDGRFSSATRDNYAEAIIKVLISPDYENKILELAGDESWCMQDLAAEVSRQTGRDIPYHDLPVDEYAALLINAGLPVDTALMVAHWGPLIAEQNALFDDQHGLSTLLGRPTTPLAEAVSIELARL